MTQPSPSCLLYKLAIPFIYLSPYLFSLIHESNEREHPQYTCTYILLPLSTFTNPRHTYAAWVTVLSLCVCVSFRYFYLSGHFVACAIIRIPFCYMYVTEHACTCVCVRVIYTRACIQVVTLVRISNCAEGLALSTFHFPCTHHNVNFVEIYMYNVEIVYY